MQNDIIAMDDLSNYSQSQDAEKKLARTHDNKNLFQQYSQSANLQAAVGSHTYSTPSKQRPVLPPLNRGTSTISTVPYEQVDQDYQRISVSSIAPLIQDVNSNKSTVPPLPPIPDKHTNIVSTSTKRFT